MQLLRWSSLSGSRQPTVLKYQENDWWLAYWETFEYCQCPLTIYVVQAPEYWPPSLKKYNDDWANLAAIETLDAVGNSNFKAGEIGLDEEFKDALFPHTPQKSSKKEHVVLGQLTLAEVWINMSKTTLPSWIGHAPPKLCDERYCKLSADQLWTACIVNLVITLIHLWGLKSPNDHQHQMLVNFMDLVTACKLAMMQKMTLNHIELFQQHMHRYLKIMKELYVYSGLTSNHHLSLHHPKLFENFGPPHA